MISRIFKPFKIFKNLKKIPRYNFGGTHDQSFLEMVETYFKNAAEHTDIPPD